MSLSLPVASLNELLKKFYVEARRKDKQPYTKSSLTAIRFGLCRHIKNSRPDVDIINGPEFEEANRVFKAKTVELKRQGKAKVEHKPPIAPEDLKKLYRSQTFDMATPTGLQNKVWFEVMLFFCRRGQENLRELKRDSFRFGVDASGRRYAFQNRDELTKNRREDSEAEEGGFMYEKQDDPMCPVRSLDMYISKFNPECDAFFQRPKKQTTEGSLAWYDKQVVGINTLGSKMKALSKQAQLSREYTNHSIRATSVTILDQCGFEARHIMCISGHKSETSIRSYASKTSDGVKLAMSSGLSNALCDVPDKLPIIGHNSTAPREPLQDIQNSVITQNKTVTIDSTTSSSKSQFSFYNCTVHILNK